MSERKAWTDKRAEIMGRPGAGAAYEAARIRFELGEAIRRQVAVHIGVRVVHRSDLLVGADDAVACGPWSPPR